MEQQIVTTEVSIPKEMEIFDAVTAIKQTFERMGYAAYIDEPTFLEPPEYKRERAGETHFVVKAYINFTEDVDLPERLDIRWVNDVNICWGERYF